MGVSKTEKFTDRQNQIASLAKGLGHPARVAILEHLFKIRGCVCGDLVEEIGLAQPTISQHLKALKKLGLIQGSVAGASVCYCINPDRWTDMKEILFKFLDSDLTIPQPCTAGGV